MENNLPRGRKPQAIEVQEANGAFRKNPQRSPTHVVKSDPRLPEAPAFVLSDPIAKSVWDETVDVLKDCGILSKTDTHLLTSYVTTYSEWQKCYIHVSQHGHKDENGKTSPESVTFHKLADRHTKLLAELGLSPSSRARLSVASSTKKEEEGASLASIISAMKGN